jgi:hypothetical protein
MYFSQATETKLGGRFTFPGTSLTVQRIGYGAMQLAGLGRVHPAGQDRGRPKYQGLHVFRGWTEGMVCGGEDGVSMPENRPWRITWSPSAMTNPGS